MKIDFLKDQINSMYFLFIHIIVTSSVTKMKFFSNDETAEIRVDNK